MDDNQTRNIKGEGHHHQKPSKTFESIKKIAEGSENVSEDDEEDEDYGEAEQYRPEQYANNHNQNQLKYFDERFKNGSDFSKNFSARDRGFGFIKAWAWDKSANFNSKKREHNFRRKKLFGSDRNKTTNIFNLDDVKKKKRIKDALL
ncbi:hypothetical protein QR98_0077670 [Sarcoptes scabiei]|uniref:Uncharacterized protein n=1 Tax=Sarcoptes scabiei TaxID=52283 RepID=A0A132AE25_SARSC|nr:hypothetical protein QR98_0077670 [Sarcoptes scabiei]